MGCDIHCFVEKQAPDGTWFKLDGFVSDLYSETDKYFSSDEFRFTDQPTQTRNYTLFGLLADVRNGVGFAGCDIGDPVKPLAAPKGLPIDVSEEIEAEYLDWGVDAHSCSYFTVQELLAYNPKEQTKTHRGWVDAKVYKQFLETGNPYPASGDVSGMLVKKTKPETILAEQKADPGHNYYCQIQWQESMLDACPGFFQYTLPQLKERCENSDFSDVRIVFWFDS